MTEFTIGDPPTRHMSARLGTVPYPPTSCTVTTALNQPSRAHFEIDATFLAPVDLTAPIDLIGDAGTGKIDRPMFSGHVTRAQVAGGRIVIDAEGARELAESTSGYWLAENCSPGDLAYALAREAGFSEENIEIEGLDDLPPEVFVVEMLIVGLHTDGSTVGTGIDVNPVDDDESLGAFRNLDPQLLVTNQPVAKFRAYTTASLMHKAQLRGVQRINTVFDAVLTTATYGLSADPWGNPLEFDRDQLRARPYALPFVYVYGVATRRRWLRSLSAGLTNPPLDLNRVLTRWERLLATTPDRETARAMRALRDAADDSRDPFDRCHAISTVLEYYAASSNPPQAVQRSTVKAAQKAIRDLNLAPDETRRLVETIGFANTPPLFTRVRHQAESDGVPVTDPEWDLMKKLRTARNKSVHGHGEQQTPSSHEMRWAVSVAARLLLNRWATTSLLTSFSRVRSSDGRDSGGLDLRRPRSR